MQLGEQVFFGDVTLLVWKVIFHISERSSSTSLKGRLPSGVPPADDWLLAAALIVIQLHLIWADPEGEAERE